jgi:hypothetical protein
MGIDEYVKKQTENIIAADCDRTLVNFLSHWQFNSPSNITSYQPHDLSPYDHVGGPGSTTFRDPTREQYGG